jgi:hypothetical protein
VLPSGHSVISFLPSKGWPLFVSELGFQRNVFQPEVKVPFGVFNLEVVAFSVELIGIAPFIGEFPSWKLQPSLRCLSTEKNEILVFLFFFPSKPKCSSSWVALEVTSCGIDMFFNWMLRDHCSILPEFELPICVFEFHETPVFAFLFDFDLGDE